MFGRFAPIAAPISGYPGTRYAIFFVTRSTTAYALDAHDGKLLWKKQVRTGLNNLLSVARTGAVAATWGIYPPPASRISLVRGGAGGAALTLALGPRHILIRVN